jgi:16S rRNA processing protein RimM
VGEAVVIGVVVRAHGVHGLVRARPTGPTMAELQTGEPIELSDRDGRTRRLVLTSHTPAGDAMLVGFEGIATRENADALRGGTILVDASRLPAGQDPGEFYVRDLVGCTVTMGDAQIGTVGDVINRPANDVLDIVDPDGHHRLLPFTRDAIVRIDLAARQIELRADLIDAPPRADTGGDGDAG